MFSSGVDTAALMERELAKLQLKLVEARQRHLAIGESISPTRADVDAAAASSLRAAALAAGRRPTRVPANLAPSLTPPPPSMSVRSIRASNTAAAPSPFTPSSKQKPQASVRVTRNGSIHINSSRQRAEILAMRAALGSPASPSRSTAPPYRAPSPVGPPPTLAMPTVAMADGSDGSARLLSSPQETIKSLAEELNQLRTLTAAAREPVLAPPASAPLTTPSSAGIAAIKDRYLSESLRRSEIVAPEVGGPAASPEQRMSLEDATALAESRRASLAAVYEAAAAATPERRSELEAAAAAALMGIPPSRRTSLEAAAAAALMRISPSREASREASRSPSRSPSAASRSLLFGALTNVEDYEAAALREVEAEYVAAAEAAAESAALATREAAMPTLSVEFTVDALDEEVANAGSEALTRADFGATFQAGLRAQLEEHGASSETLDAVGSTKVESVRVIDGLELQIERLGTSVHKSVESTLTEIARVQSEAGTHVDEQVAALSSSLAQKIESAQSAVKTQGVQLDNQVSLIETKLAQQTASSAEKVGELSSELAHVRNTVDDASRQSARRVEDIASKVRNGKSVVSPRSLPRAQSKARGASSHPPIRPPTSLSFLTRLSPRPPTLLRTPPTLFLSLPQVLELENVLRREHSLDEKFRDGVITMLHEIRIAKSLERAPLPPKPETHRPGLLSRSVVPFAMRSTAVVPSVPLLGNGEGGGGAASQRQLTLRRSLNDVGHPDLLHAVLARVRSELHRRAVTSVDLFQRCGGSGYPPSAVKAKRSPRKQRAAERLAALEDKRVTVPIMRPPGITPRQLTRGLESIGVKLFAGERDVLFAAMDTNLDGRITLEEMREMLFGNKNKHGYATITGSDAHVGRSSTSLRRARSARDAGLDMSRPATHFAAVDSERQGLVVHGPGAGAAHPVFSPLRSSSSGGGGGGYVVGGGSARAGGNSQGTSFRAASGGWTRSSLGGARNDAEWAEGAPARRGGGGSLRRAASPRRASPQVFQATRSARSPKLAQPKADKDAAVDFMRLLQQDPPTFRRFKGVMQTYKSRPECVVCAAPQHCARARARSGRDPGDPTRPSVHPSLSPLASLSPLVSSLSRWSFTSFAVSFGTVE